MNNLDFLPFFSSHFLFGTSLSVLGVWRIFLCLFECSNDMLKIHRSGNILNATSLEVFDFPNNFPVFCSNDMLEIHRRSNTGHILRVLRFWKSIAASGHVQIFSNKLMPCRFSSRRINKNMQSCQNSFKLQPSTFKWSTIMFWHISYCRYSLIDTRFFVFKLK